MNAKIEQAVAVKTSTMGELFGAAASNAANVPLEVRVTESPLVPAVEDYYTFLMDGILKNGKLSEANLDAFKRWQG